MPQVAQGLGRLWNTFNFAHGYLTPENVVTDISGQVKLTNLMLRAPDIKLSAHQVGFDMTTLTPQLLR